MHAAHCVRNAPGMGEVPLQRPGVMAGPPLRLRLCGLKAHDRLFAAVVRNETGDARTLLATTRLGVRRLSANYRPWQLWDLPLFGRPTLLHLAVTGRHIEMIALLLEHGADPRAADGDGLTPRALAERMEALYPEAAAQMLETLQRRRRRRALASARRGCAPSPLASA